MVALRRLSTSYGISASRLLDCPEGLLHEDATIRSMKRRGSDSLKNGSYSLRVILRFVYPWVDTDTKLRKIY